MTGTTMQKGYVPLLGRGIAVYNSSGIAYYRHSDHLGSSRFASTPTQAMYSDTAYSAFGEPYAPSGTTDVSFTGQDQDTTAGVYDFLYRKYDPGQSRWVSPDPAGLAAVSFDNPQSLNRYAYVLNNPLLLIDPLGLDFCQWDDGKDDSPEDGGAKEAKCLVDGGTWVTTSGANAGCTSTMVGSGIQLNCPPPPGIPTLSSGVGNISGPTIGPAPRLPIVPCRIEDAILGALEFSVKLGPEAQLGPAKVGASLYKNFSSGETGGSADLTLGLVGAKLDNKTPQGGNLGGTTEGNQFVVNAFGFEKNFTTGEPAAFKPSSSLGRFGLQLGIGFEVSFNPDKFNAISRANDACRAQGGT
jgi:RHS repeat-associated protein